MSELKPVKGKIFTLPFFILLILSVIAIPFIVKTVYVWTWCSIKSK